MDDFQSACQSYRERAEAALSARLPDSAAAATTTAADQSIAATEPTAAPAQLADAMRYACLNGGKRFRATLVYACGEIAGAPADALDAPAAAVEMLHAYSLIHDDLPAMDDDDLRRGCPTCHIAFGEAAAILAGDALQSLAFEVLSADSTLKVSDARRLRMLKTLATAAGAHGMAGGQMLDMLATGAGQPPDASQLARMHKLKTGALIRAAAQLGGLAAEHADDELLKRLDDYAANVGLAFQIADDILDVEGGDGMGKPSGADRRMNKSTYAQILGLEKARTEAQKLCDNAVAAAATIGEVVAEMVGEVVGEKSTAAEVAARKKISDNANFLAHLARFAVNRSF